MKINKLIAILLAIALLSALTACGRVKLPDEPLTGVWQMSHNTFSDIYPTGDFWIFADDGTCEIYNIRDRGVGIIGLGFSLYSYEFDRSSNVLTLSWPGGGMDCKLDWDKSYSSFAFSGETENWNYTFTKCDENILGECERIDGWKQPGADGTFTAIADNGDVVSEKDLFGTWVSAANSWSSLGFYTFTKNYQMGYSKTRDEISPESFTDEEPEKNGVESRVYQFRYYPDSEYLVRYGKNGTPDSNAFYWVTASTMGNPALSQFVSEPKDVAEDEIDDYRITPNGLFAYRDKYVSVVEKIN